MAVDPNARTDCGISFPKAAKPTDATNDSKATKASALATTR